MFTVMFPLTFLANTFAPTENMPTVLRTIAEWNPVSSLTQAARELWGNGPAAPADAAFPLQSPGALHDRLGAADHRGVRAASAGCVPAPVPRLTPPASCAAAAARTWCSGLAKERAAASPTSRMPAGSSID